MGNIKREQINKRFHDDSEQARIEEYCINVVTNFTDKMLEDYSKLPESRGGTYINSDLMKMTFDFYAESLENRKNFNLSVTNSAAVLTNELYTRAIKSEQVEKCIYILGPYGAGKSYFVQSLFEEKKLLDNSIVYEGSITPPAFDDKIQLAINNGVTPYLIVINPTLSLSIGNIKERAKRIGRDVEKKEILDTLSNFYTYMKMLTEKFKGIDYLIYNKKSNTKLDWNNASKNIEDLNHGSLEEIESEYEKIITSFERKDSSNVQFLKSFLKKGIEAGITLEDLNDARNAEKTNNLEKAEVGKENDES